MKTVEYVGYHGTESSKAKRIIKTGFTINQRHRGWLGKGIYFFEDDKDLAKKYSEKRHPQKISNVIKSHLKVPDNKVFDTTVEIGRFTFFQYRKQLKERMKKTGNKYKFSNSNHVDGIVYDMIVSEKGYDLIRAETFTSLNDDLELEIPESKVPNGTELCLKVANYAKDNSLC